MAAFDADSAGGGDLAYDPNFVPDSVKTFVVDLYRYIREKNVYEIHQMYEGSFNRLTDRMFRESPWPTAEAVAPYVDGDHVFCLLYREMWFRHVYARLTPTPKQRLESWDNYCSLFGVVLHGVVNMQLPNQWLWDMVDEFVYQFQSYCQYRAKLKNKTEEELQLLRNFDQAWNVYGVLNYLQALAEKSNIFQILEREKEGLEQFTATDGYDYQGGSNVLKMLGYYSMIGLLRAHCLLGDYRTGPKCMAPIDLSQQGVYTIVIGSHISTIYHYGFANLMLRRYGDAIREFNKILLYILKYKQYHQKSLQYDQILKKNEQMYALLAVCLSLCPQSKLLDENVSTQLKEKYNDKMTKMQRYDDESSTVYDELFSYGCPKFITPSAPALDEPLTNYNQEAYRLQLKMFLFEVKQQQLLAGIRSFLKIYSSMTVAKLAQFMEVDEATLRTILMTYKHKMHSTDNDGKIVSNADIDFYINDDTVHVVEAKLTKQFGDFFLRQILKLKYRHLINCLIMTEIMQFEEMITELDKVQTCQQEEDSYEYTCYVDGAWIKPWSGGVGFMIYKQGKLEVYRSEGIQSYCAIQSEATALLHAIEYVEQQGLSPALFYSDSSELVSHCKKNSPPVNANRRAAHEISQCWMAIRRNKNFAISHVSRSHNELADLLAKRGRREGAGWSYTGHTFPLFED